MNFTISFAEINWLSVIVVTILSFALGAFWHSSVLFGKAWKEDVKPDFDEKNIKFVRLFGLSALFHFIALVGLDAFIGTKSSLTDGLSKGLFVGLIWVATGIGVNYLFAQRPLRLLFIDAGYYIVFLSLAGLIFGAW
jgi:hypothetical protein